MKLTIADCRLPITNYADHADCADDDRSERTEATPSRTPASRVGWLAISLASGRRATRSPAGWPASVCWHRLCRARSSPWRSTTKRTRPSRASRCRPSRSSFSSHPPAVIGPGDAIVLPAGRGARRPRGRSRPRHRPPRQPRAGRSRRRVHPRRDLRERRHGARAAKEGRALHAAQGFRHLRAGRAVHRCRAGLVGSEGAGLGQRRRSGRTPRLPTSSSRFPSWWPSSRRS